MRVMTSKERMDKFYRGERIDRVPVYASATMYAGRRQGLSSEEFYFDVKKSYQVQKKECEIKEFDDIPCLDIPNGEALDFGGALHIPDSSTVELPRMKKYAINSLEEADAYELPPVEKREFTKLKIKYAKYALSQGETGVSICGGSPFTMLGSLVPMDLLLVWLLKEPEIVHKLLENMVEYLCQSADIMIHEFGAEKCSVFSNFPLESMNILSPEMFRQFSLPFALDIHEKLRKKGLKNFGIHLCGKHTDNLPYFKELHLTERSFISSDEANNLVEVSKILGEENIYAGNVPTYLLVIGTPEQVYQYSENIINKMKNNPGGFVLMPSCDLPLNAKPDNLSAMVQAAKDFGYD